MALKHLKVIIWVRLKEIIVDYLENKIQSSALPPQKNNASSYYFNRDTSE